MIGIENNVLRFDISVQDPLLMTVLQAIGDLSDLALNGRLKDVPRLIDQLMVPIRLKSVRLWHPVKKLAALAVFHDKDEFVFKTCLVINHFKKAHNVGILTIFREGDHGLDFGVHDLHELVCGDHAMAVFAPMVFFLGAEHLLFPNLKHDLLRRIRSERSYRELAKRVGTKNSLHDILAIVYFPTLNMRINS